MTQPWKRPTRPRRQVLLLNWRDTGHPEGGGSEVYAEHVADGLQGQDYDVTLLTARYAGSRANEVRDSGVRVVRRGGRLTVYPRAALAVLLRTVARPDVIIEVQNGMPYLAALWAARTPHVVLVHHSHREQWPVVFGPVAARVGWFLESRVAPFVNRRRPYVAVSELTRSELVELGVHPGRVTVIHSGTLPPPSHDVERSPQPQLLVLGRLVPHKRVELAVAAVERLRAEFPSVRLVVAGRGWWEPQLREQVIERGLDEVVDLVGFVSDKERHRLYASSWVLLVPSLKEGWGLVVLEAGLHEIPSVAFHGAGGVAESVHDGDTGLLAREDDLDHFVELIRSLLSRPERRMELGRNAAEFAGYFTWEQTAKSFAELLDGLLSGPSARAPRGVAGDR